MSTSRRRQAGGELDAGRKFTDRPQAHPTSTWPNSFNIKALVRVCESPLRHPLRSPPSCGPDCPVRCLRGHSLGCFPRCPVRYLPRNQVSNSAGCSVGCLLRCLDACPAGCSVRRCPDRSPLCPPRSSGRCLPGCLEDNGLSYSEGRLPSCCAIGGGDLLVS